MPFTLDPDSVQPSTVGDVYAFAMGYQDPVSGNTRMVGYNVTPTGGLTESTDLQDEEHLVQVASPSSSDRFGRFPRVSQGDWSGGERQLIFINANAYYQSTQLDTSKPGHLTCLATYSTVSIPNGVDPLNNTGTTFPSARTVSAGPNRAYFMGVNAGTYYISSYSLLTGVVHTVALTSGPGQGIPREFLRSSDFPVYVGTSTGIWGLTDTGTAISMTTQAVNDALAQLNGSSMAQFEGTAYYLVGTGAPNKINSFTYPLPGAGAGTAAFTAAQMEHLVQSLGRGATGLIFVTGASPSINSYVYSFDGANPNFLGRLETQIADICEANGTVYLLTYAQTPSGAIPNLPVIYSVSGSTLNVFDDFRSVDPTFLPLFTNGNAAPNGHIESDGTWLYLWTSGLSVKRYRLSTSSVMDVGNPLGASAVYGARAGTVLGNGSFAEIESGVTTTSMYVTTLGLGPNADGTLLTSWYDFGSPDVDKAFKQIEFTLNSTVNAGAFTTLTAQINSPANPTIALTAQVASGNTLVAYLPGGTLGRRIRFSITLSHAINPDVQSYGVSATLGRIFSVTVNCASQQNARGGTDVDPQRLTSTQLLANIQNCYTLAGGNVTLWIPDPTVTAPMVGTGSAVAIGVSQINAQLQDYQRQTTGGIAPAYRTMPDASQDMEATVALTLNEIVG